MIFSNCDHAVDIFTKYPNISLHTKARIHCERSTSPVKKSNLNRNNGSRMNYDDNEVIKYFLPRLSPSHLKGRMRTGLLCANI